MKVNSVSLLCRDTLSLQIAGMPPAHCVRNRKSKTKPQKKMMFLNLNV